MSFRNYFSEQDRTFKEGSATGRNRCAIADFKHDVSSRLRADLRGRLGSDCSRCGQSLKGEPRRPLRLDPAPR
jgi:hypothetical protein